VKLLVCGGRTFMDDAFMFATLDMVHKRRPVSIVIHGGAKGADHYAELWAVARGIHYARVPALWESLGKAAGPKRNEAMLLLAPDAVVAFAGGRGTAHMVKIARDAGIKVWEPTV
jgi:hypothetical protein